MRKRFACLFLAALAFTAACGDSPAPMSPMAPSAVNSPGNPSGPTSGAMLTGTVTVASSVKAVTPAATGGLTVSVTGTNLSTPVDSNGSFALDGVPPGDIRIRINGPSVDVTLTVSGVQIGQTIRLKITVSGNTGTIESDSRDGPATDPNKRELEGRIETIMSATSSLMVSGQLVTTVPATVIRKGGTTVPFGALLVGMRVHVKGTMDSTTTPPSLAATEIVVQNENTDVPMKVEGVVAAAPAILHTGCPSITFALAGKAITVTTDGKTSFKPSCFEVKAGATVEVQGRLQGPSAPTDGDPTPAPGSTILADKVDVKKPAPDDGSSGTGELKYTGAIHDLGGSCPAISFFVGDGNPLISTSSSTSFKPSCNALRNGDTVEVKAIASGGTTLATTVERR